METSVWTQLSALVAAITSLLSKFSPSQLNQSSGGESPNVPASLADSIKTSTNVKSPVLRVIRDPAMATADGVFGVLEYNGERVCFTMENRALSIPAGTYELQIYDSPHAGHPVPLLQNVTGRSGIEIHCGNVPEDSKGCIIVGLDHIGDTLARSRDAFDIIFSEIQTDTLNGRVFMQVLDCGE